MIKLLRGVSTCNCFKEILNNLANDNDTSEYRFTPEIYSDLSDYLSPLSPSVCVCVCVCVCVSLSLSLPHSLSLFIGGICYSNTQRHLVYKSQLNIPQFQPDINCTALPHISVLIHFSKLYLMDLISSRYLGPTGWNSKAYSI